MAPMNRGGTAQLSTPPFSELLEKCRSSAVHLELRDSYGTNPRFEAWQRGERINWGNHESWWHPFHTGISDAVTRGVHVRPLASSPSPSVSTSGGSITRRRQMCVLEKKSAGFPADSQLTYSYRQTTSGSLTVSCSASTTSPETEAW